MTFQALHLLGPSQTAQSAQSLRRRRLHRLDQLAVKQSRAGIQGDTLSIREPLLILISLPSLSATVTGRYFTRLSPAITATNGFSSRV